jgi:hypothetical protein
VGRGENIQSIMIIDHDTHAKPDNPEFSPW